MNGLAVFLGIFLGVIIVVPLGSLLSLVLNKYVEISMNFFKKRFFDKEETE